MDLLTTLHRSGGIVALARQLRVAPASAAAAVERLLPELVAAFRNIHASEGAAGFPVRLMALGGAFLAAEIMGAEAADPARGFAVLDWLGLDVGRLPAGDTEQDESLLERIFPLLAMLTGGYLAATTMRGEDGEAALAGLLAEDMGSNQSSYVEADPEL